MCRRCSLRRQSAGGRIDIIYNNAGIGMREDNVRDCPEPVFDEIMAVNLRARLAGDEVRHPPP